MIDCKAGQWWACWGTCKTATKLPSVCYIGPAPSILLLDLYKIGHAIIAMLLV